MEVCFMASGERLVVIEPVDVQGICARVVKQRIAPLVGVSRFRQRLLEPGGVSEIEDGEILKVTAKVMLVVVDFVQMTLTLKRALMAVVTNNDCVRLERMLSEPWSPNVIVDERNEMSSLHYSAKRGALEASMLLLEAGADRDAVDRFGETPLHIACLFGHASTVDILLKAGADTNLSRPLLMVSQKGYMDCLRLLVVARAVVDNRYTVGDQKLSPLMVAAMNGHRDVVRLLLDSGARGDFTMADGCEALELVASKPDAGVAKLLVNGRARECKRAKTSASVFYV